MQGVWELNTGCGSLSLDEQPQTAAIVTPRLPELGVVVFVALLVFGERLPVLARYLGRSLWEFGTGLDEGEPKQRQDASPGDSVDQVT